ncbi:malto-oligosyltrehalose synthase [Candidatus Micrarchaeota archaeon]|nr:malto-oligosyltrehalose synthase [Candidatus Micrarchaeota archaeon]
MHAPVATYRLQFNPEFAFRDAAKIIPYLDSLGVSTIYASPIFQARKKSMHGYDIVNVRQIRNELGGTQGFQRLLKAVRRKKMNWLQDIVPNHMAYDRDNAWLMDVLLKGKGSRYRFFFDVDWNHPSPALKGRVLAPFLGKPYSQCLRDSELIIEWKNGWRVRYFDTLFPIALPRNSHGRVQASFRGHAPDRKVLEEWMEQQHYRLTDWRTTAHETNYRRFFDINGLIAISVEHPRVFKATHRLIRRMSRWKGIIGFRVDHVDGLKDPRGYLARLRKTVRDYIIIEKILAENEVLNDWPIQGTTGYEFLYNVNGLFVDKKKEPAFNEIYTAFTGVHGSPEQRAFHTRLQVARNLFFGDAKNLARMALATSKKPRSDQSVEEVAKALCRLMAAFPVYRTYFEKKHWNVKDQQTMQDVFRAVASKSKKQQRLFRLLQQSFETAGNRSPSRAFVTRFQQYTGAVMAKGFEDTFMFRYNRLLSLNEVGGNPARFGISPESMHAFGVQRQQSNPLSLNASSTHDTKRGEDARARLNVLSEIPDEWKSHLRKWAHLNAHWKQKKNGSAIPTPNEEYYFYQTLLGAQPFGKPTGLFRDRLKEHMTKALREAKEHSSWTAPSQAYEEATQQFIDRVMHPRRNQAFLHSFRVFKDRVAEFGIWNSLSQTLIKITFPGVPDIYQGSESWNYSLTDPDNRTPVSYASLQKKMKRLPRTATPSSIRQWLKHRSDGRIKLFVVRSSLQLRKQHRVLFEKGTYSPLYFQGPKKHHAFGYLRQHQNDAVMVVVPRLVATLCKNQRIPFGKRAWENTHVLLPSNAPNTWRNIFTNEIIIATQRRGQPTIACADLMQRFPVSLLVPVKTI